MFDWIKLVITTFVIILVLLFAVLFGKPALAETNALTTIVALEKQPETTSSSTQELEQLTEAKNLMANNRLEQANELLTELIKTHADNPEVHFTYGVVNGYLAKQASIFSAGKYAQTSKNAFLASIQTDPNFVKGYEGLIRFYLNAPAIAGGSTKKAVNMAEKLQKVSPLHGTLNLFNIAQNKGDDNQLTQLAAKLENEFSDLPQAQFALGFYYQDLGQYEVAFQAFKRAVKPSLGTINMKEKQEDERKAIQSAMYQLGRNAVFSKAHIDEGIAAMNQYLQQDIENDLPSKTWGQYRLSQLYVLNDEANKAEPLLLELKALLAQPQHKDKELSRLVSKSLKQL